MRSKWFFLEECGLPKVMEKLPDITPPQRLFEHRRVTMECSQWARITICRGCQQRLRYQPTAQAIEAAVRRMARERPRRQAVRVNRPMAREILDRQRVRASEERSYQRAGPSFHPGWDTQMSMRMVQLLEASASAQVTTQQVEQLAATQQGLLMHLVQNGPQAMAQNGPPTSSMTSTVQTAPGPSSASAMMPAGNASGHAAWQEEMCGHSPHSRWARTSTN